MVYILKYVTIIFIIDCVLQARTASLDCSFDDDFCDWRQSTADDFNWIRERWKTPSGNSDTGPSSDHTTGDRKGYYIFTEASYPRKTDDKARLNSPMQEPGPHCFMFWYSMYGRDIGTLNVYLVPNNTVIFTRSGDIGDRNWRSKALSINETAKYQIVIEGVRGNGRKGDIAVDDTSMVTGLCAIDCNNPAPEHGKVNSTNFQYGSVVEIKCRSGYYVRGKASIVCQAGGTWSANPTCEPVDCNNPVPKHRRVNSTNFQHGSVVEITCSSGYHVKGKASIVCQAGGTWSSSPTCEPVECVNPIPKHGEVNSTDFYYGSVIQIACNIGYNISGSSVSFCQADGEWTHMPTCDIIDCGSRTIANGNFSTASGTTFGNTATQSCKVDYIISGDAVVTCIESGWNASAATCTNVDSENNAMIAVYVLVPVAAVAVVIAVLFVIFRQKIMKYLSALCANQEHEKKEQPHSSSPFSNATYSGHHNEMQSNPDGILPEDTEYAIIMDDGNGKGADEKNIYYNNVDPMLTEQKKVKQNYDHAKLPATPALDNSNSHLSEEKDRFESSYDTTSVIYHGNISFQTDTSPKSNNYDVLNIKTSKQSQGKNLQSNMPRNRDPEYDHAQARGIDPVDLDDYSHLNANFKSRECSETESDKLNNGVFSGCMKGTETNDKTNEIDEATYEQAVGETPQYFILEVENGDKGEDKTNETDEAMYEQAVGETPQYFMPEAENGNAHEAGGHYFVLEKEEKRYV